MVWGLAFTMLCRPDPSLPNPRWLQTDPFTLSAYVLSLQHIKAPDAKGRLTVLLNSISTGCKFVSMSVRRVGVPGRDRSC